MAEKCSRSKLKRIKPSVKELQPVTPKRIQTAPISGGTTADTGRSAVPAAAWWNSEENLWASTLKSALPDLENQHWDPVPDLPSAARPTALKSDDQRWCDLSEEVPPFPEPSPPPPRTPSSPLSSSQQELPAPTTPAPHLSSHSRQTHRGNATFLQAVAKTPRPSSHRQVETPSSAGPSGVGGDQEEETRLLLTNQEEVSDSRDALQKDGESEEEMVEDREEEEVQRSVGGAAAGGGAAGGGGGGGAGLQSCPMCLLVFPAGFSQMDCDGHLAQCLSDVNVDVTW